VRFRNFLFEVKQTGKTIIFSSHILADVEHLADRVAILVSGRLAAVESVEALREGLTRQCRMRLALTGLEAACLEEARRAGAEQVDVEGHYLVITSPPEKRFGILRAIHSAGAEILHFSTEEPSLEDFYLRYLHASQDQGPVQKEIKGGS
jgi:ABC-2 type transport system ATP-binding protein